MVSGLIFCTREKTARLVSRQSQAGFSLYTLIAAVAVMAVMTSIAVTQFNGSNSKGRAAYTLLGNMGTAAVQFRHDTGCYATAPKALFDYPSAQLNNSCGVVIAKSMWNGPYIQKQATDLSGDLLMTDFGPTATLSMDTSANAKVHDVALLNVTGAVAKKAFSACGGSGSPCKVKSTMGGELSQISYNYKTER